MKHQNLLILGVLLGHLSLSQAVNLAKHRKRYTSSEEEDQNDLISKHLKRYIDAADGKGKTEADYAVEERAPNFNAIYPPDRKPFELEEDDTGEKYATTHRCFGHKCNSLV